jgi:hypothetical protein
MSGKDVGLLVVITVAAVLIFLPWTHDVVVGRVALFAWLMFGLMVLAPLAGLLVALSDDDGEV